MNLIYGERLTTEQANDFLANLPAHIIRMREAPLLFQAEVLHACELLSKALQEQEYLPVLLAMGVPEDKALKELAMAGQMLSKEYLQERCKRELGRQVEQWTPYGNQHAVRQEWKPLGVLLHIAAGNMDVLPAFSVLEGLLTENINIVKLPSEDSGLSTILLERLMDICPAIKEKVFLLELSSKDLHGLTTLAEAVDGIVVWGSEEAVSAVRKLAPVRTKLIEWGPKISFAYLSGDFEDALLEELALHMLQTNQLLCSSCQGIFVDTASWEKVLEEQERFFKILYEKACALGRSKDLFLVGQKTLEAYTAQLLPGQKRVLRGGGCSVIAYPKAQLRASFQFGNCWISPLPRKQLLETLLPYGNYLQTVALICPKEERKTLELLFEKTGICRITSAANMSASYCGMPHDGEFPLQRYMKRMSYEYLGSANSS